MKLRHLALFICPDTFESLALEDGADVEGEDIISGTVRNASRTRHYAIRAGVLDLSQPAGSLDQQRTLESFGSEWSHFDRWGWFETPPSQRDDDLEYWGGLLSNTRSAFRGKAPFREGDLGPGKLVLDVGCGNGRFSFVASETGATIISLDASDSAFVAARNLGPSATVVRANALRMPFKDGTFDAAFSIGVMQHTGDGPGFLREIARVVKDNHPFTVNCYGTGMRSYEFVDAALRRIVTRMPPAKQMTVASKLASFDRFMTRGGPARKRARQWLYGHMNLLPTTIHMLDWYSPALAEHYCPDQILDWLSGVATITNATPAFHVPGYDDRTRKKGHGAMQFRAVKAPGSSS